MIWWTNTLQVEKQKWMDGEINGMLPRGNKLELIRKLHFRQIWEAELVNRDFSQREMFDMSLLYSVNIAEYVDLFEDEEYMKVTPFWIEQLGKYSRKAPMNGEG